jgi:hypothetical protein
VGAAAGLDFSVRVGAVVAFADVVPELVGAGVGVLVVGGLDVVDAGVADGLLGVAVGEEGVGEGDWLGGAAGSCSGSHD